MLERDPFRTERSIYFKNIYKKRRYLSQKIRIQSSLWIFPNEKFFFKHELYHYPLCTRNKYDYINFLLQHLCTSGIFILFAIICCYYFYSKSMTQSLFFWPFYVYFPHIKFPPPFTSQQNFLYHIPKTSTKWVFSKNKEPGINTQI